jgi:ABC-type lipoprotein release transport system permease subunit
MKLALQLAYKNLIGAGLRTWLNVIVLSFTYLMIVFFNGLMDGWNLQARNDTIAWEIGGGQVRHAEYDPNDPFTLADAKAEIPTNLQNSTAVLVHQASIYPEGRLLPVVLKGITVDQGVLKLPTDSLRGKDFTVIVGKRMADQNGLRSGDQILIRWRDKNGTFDARQARVAAVFQTDVSSVDQGQVWMSLKDLQEMTGLENHATYFVLHPDSPVPETGADWDYYSNDQLMESLLKIVETKKASSSIMYLLLLAIALLAVFDTQVLSIFRRQKEIGTLVALGMTRWQVVGIFTMEGAMYSFMAMALAALYGSPLLWLLQRFGFKITEASQNVGITVGDKIYPVYGLELIVWTILLVTISATIVSFIPARKISRMDPVAALKGKLQ